jgi:hypothetical protein
MMHNLCETDSAEDEMRATLDFAKDEFFNGLIGEIRWNRRAALYPFLASLCNFFARRSRQRMRNRLKLVRSTLFEMASLGMHVEGQYDDLTQEAEFIRGLESVQSENHAGQPSQGLVRCAVPGSHEA